MKFDCGETWAEKYKRLTQWHDYFAWRPVRISDHDCRWLETIQRKGEVLWGEWDWEYRAK